MAATCRACGKPYTRRRVVAVSGQLALTLIVTHSLFCFARQEAKTLVATSEASQMDTLTRFGSEPFNFPPPMLSQSEGGPRVCSSDEKECVDLAQVLGVARPTAWTSLEKVESDFGRWLPRLLTMARRLADLLMHTSGPEKLNRPHKNTQSAQPSNSPVRQKPVLTCTSRRHAVQLNASISRDSRTRFLITTRGPQTSCHGRPTHPTCFFMEPRSIAH